VIRIKFTIILFVLAIFSGQAQKVVVADSVSKKTLPFVTVKYGDTGFYTNEKGTFIWTQDQQIDSIELSHLGYENLTIRREKIKDTIYLVPTPAVLDEVIVSSKKQHTEFIKPNKKARFVGSFLLSPKTEILSVLYPNGKYTDAYIEKIHILITKKFPFEIKSKTTEAVLRVNIYKVVDGLPTEQLYSSTSIKISGHSKDEISIDLSDENITMNSDGLCFGLEMIGFYDNYQEVKPENTFVRVVLTNKENKAFSAKTYLRFLFDEKDIYHPLNDLLDKRSEGLNISKHIKHNLSIGFDLILN